ncbi:hypothetical protein GMAR_ORF11 [Golden Marseillevirus]|uniref:hypothetical protein n=1 Tax=Golden Marseillevirus TaxID=1720526 RepID=UPI000877AD20|nr:hypothetical protein GMAR_ORF11 [Golden Marseillevirus]ALX27386.1 hypothetical protein GMAR_ORF11 [Golden Marseillevirus]
MNEMLPTLYSKAKTGKLMQWRVWTEEGEVVKEFGYKEGKLRQVRTKAKPKNSGKSNATTSAEQAVLEAKADWMKQLDKGYFADSEDEEASSFVSDVLQAKEGSGGNNHKILQGEVAKGSKNGNREHHLLTDARGKVPTNYGAKVSSSC